MSNPLEVIRQERARLEQQLTYFSEELRRQTLLAAYRQERIKDLEAENERLRGKCMCTCNACKYCEQLLEAG